MTARLLTITIMHWSKGLYVDMLVLRTQYKAFHRCAVFCRVLAPLAGLRVLSLRHCRLFLWPSLLNRLSNLEVLYIERTGGQHGQQCPITLQAILSTQLHSQGLVRLSPV